MPAQVKVNSTASQVDTSKYVMKKSPWGAVLRSAVIPGFGQFYNESYWKIPVVWGFLGYFLYGWNYENNAYIKYRDLYAQSITAGSASSDLSAAYYRNREGYKDLRDLFAIYIGITYFLNLVDAYVDAQLFDFNVNENQFGQTVQISLKIKF